MSKPILNATTLPAPVHPELAKGLVFDDPKHHLRIYQGDCLEILAECQPVASH